LVPCFSGFPYFAGLPLAPFRCCSASLTRPFRYPLSRCPGLSVSQQALPVTGAFLR
jgi:hypothetical protein